MGGLYKKRNNNTFSRLRSILPAEEKNFPPQKRGGGVYERVCIYHSYAKWGTNLLTK
jgi:hypothetical protein